MTEYICIVTPSQTEGEPPIRLIYPAEKVVTIVNNAGAIGVVFEGQDKGMAADVIITKTSLEAAIEWLKSK